MRRTLLIPLLALTALVAGTPAYAQDATVPILFAGYGAPRVDILAGDSVVWQNESVRTHTVNSADGAWSSPRLFASDGFGHHFDTPGAYAYYCQIHPSMRGEVDVHTILLDAPSEPAAPRRPYVLSGRTALPAGTEVAIETDAGVHAASATVADDHTFNATITPTETTAYHAVAGGETTQPVQVLVLDRKVTASMRASKRRITVSAIVTPASKGATVVLQLRLKEHFGWWPVRTAKLDAASRVRFSLPHGRRVPARVLLTASDGASELARSATFRLS